jgi:mono/diheme cytochrome c family protein
MHAHCLRTIPLVRSSDFVSATSVALHSDLERYCDFDPSETFDPQLTLTIGRSVRPAFGLLRIVGFLAIGVVSIWSLAVSTAPLAAQSPMPSTPAPAMASDKDSDKFFESFIRPVLVEHCLRCHGPDKAESGLRLDTPELLKQGGDSGHSLDSQTPRDSLLLQAIRYEGLEMPPNRKLDDEQIEHFEQWIAGGAVWPQYANSIATASTGKVLTEADLNYWFYQPISNAVPPPHRDWLHPIDAFVEARLEPLGLRIGERATESVLVRRVYLDLIGMPPTWRELQEYLSDPAADRYERLIEALMADHRYGERWGRYWLDLVRFAESDGFKQDAFRPSAYRYRDYVIDAIQSDKPYGDFITEQLAGDEIDPESATMNAATGYLRHWIYEYNQRDVRSQWDNILNDVTDVTGEVMLGLGFSCARCHDHKFDPLLQSDYYRLQAFFAAMEPRYDVPVSTKDYAAWQEHKAAWDLCAEPIAAEMQSIEAAIRDSTRLSTIDKFPPDVRPALLKPLEQREPAERPIALLAYLQIQNDVQALDFSKKLTGETLMRWKQLKGALDELKQAAPKPPEWALTVRDMGSLAPETRIPGRRDSPPIDPGPPTVVASRLPLSESCESHTVESSSSQSKPSLLSSRQGNSTGRRLALARWIASPDNPMSWRVITNRIWQHHFGRGLVANASDFGRLTEPPTHPELLDYLAQYLIDHEGRWKSLHHHIMMSETYRQSSYPEQRAQGHAVDPDNRWLWRHAAHRMDAEQLRDSILLVTGTLDTRIGGPSDPKDSNRRSIYQRVMRNAPHAMLATFDAPDGSVAVAKRNCTTTSLQSLFMTNAAWPLEKSQSMIQRLQLEGWTRQEMTDAVFQQILLRQPTPSEIDMVNAFLDNPVAAPDHPQPDSLANTEVDSTSNAVSEPTIPSLDGWIDLCHALFHSNEFLYVE